MAQQRKLTRKEKIEKGQTTNAKVKVQPKGNDLKLYLGLLLAAFGFLLYISTVQYSYVLDDYSTIKENYVVQQGISGIGTLLKTSYRYGYWASSDELYRPLSLIMFAVEWSFFPDNAAVGHFINVFLYAVTGFFLFNLLCRLFKNNYLIPFITTLLFMAHPVHTEVVANIKSRDEILSFLLGIASISWLLDYIAQKKTGKIILASFAFFLAMMAKESAITLLVVVPLLLFVFKEFRIPKAIATVIPLIAGAALYMIIRASVLKGVVHTKEINSLDNIIVAASGIGAHFSTAIYVLGRYLLLLIIPFHLSMDYSRDEITLMHLTDYRVLVSLAIYIAITIYAVYNIKKKDRISFAILFYLITIAIVSNILIVIGTVMADRLLYLPSLGFCLAAAILIARLFKMEGHVDAKSRIKDFINAGKKPLIAAVVLFVLYSFKTVERLPVWKDNYSLYVSGAKDAPNSSRTHYLVGIELKNVVAEAEHDSLKRIIIYKQSVDELKKAIAIYPSSFDAYRDMGRVYELLNDTADAMKSYNMALQLNPHDAKAINNKSTILFNRREYAAAMQLFEEAIRWDPRYSDALRNLGSCYGIAGDFDNALIYLFKSLDFEKNKKQIPSTYHMIGMTYQYMGNKPMSEEYFAKEKVTKESLAQ